MLHMKINMFSMAKSKTSVRPSPQTNLFNGKRRKWLTLSVHAKYKSDHTLIQIN